MQTKEPRAFCLSKSKRNRDDWDLIENYSTIWNVPVSQAIFRLAREHNQMSQWAMYNQRQVAS